MTAVAAPRRILAVLALAAAPALAQAPPPQKAPTMLCTGNVTQAAGMVVDAGRLEFTFPYGLNQQSASLSSTSALLNNAPLLLELGEAFLTGRESKARLVEGDRGLAITELRISRATGRFTMVAVVLRNLEVVEGRAAWEGECRRQGAGERKF
jgi:hypothetical protein